MPRRPVVPESLMRRLTQIVAPLVAIGLLTASGLVPQAHGAPGSEALQEHLDDKKPYNVVQNRFFLKTH